MEIEAISPLAVRKRKRSRDSENQRWPKRPALRPFPLLSARYSYDNSSSEYENDLPTSAPSYQQDLNAFNSLSVDPSLWQNKQVSIDDMEAAMREALKQSGSPILAPEDRLLIMPRWPQAASPAVESKTNAQRNLSPGRQQKKGSVRSVSSAMSVDQDMQMDDPLPIALSASPASDQKRRYTMGYRNDCMDCLNNKLGHYGHIR